MENRVIMLFLAFKSHQIFGMNKTEEDKIVETCGTQGENRNMYRVLMVKRERSYLEEQREDGRIILMWMVNKYNRRRSTFGD